MSKISDNTPFALTNFVLPSASERINKPLITQNHICVAAIHSIT